MLPDFISTLSGITEIIADAIFPIMIISFGFFMLIIPHDKYEEIFPVSISKKGLKIGGVFFITIGIIYSILLVIDLLSAHRETVTQYTSKDSSVTITVQGQWKQEDCTPMIGDESYSWLTAGWIMLTGKNDDMILVGQYPKMFFQINNLDALYEQYAADTAAGWDYSRAMTLLSFYYLTGLYTEEEALDKSLEVAKTIQNTFDS